jgi:lipopolysaccharide transport system ATP-binding protein
MEVIKVENLYKQYRLGQVSTGSIAHDLNRWWHTVRGKEDPYQKITGLNDREDADNNEYVWALQDINFSVKQGEVLGIIGRNGAGKSTLLKLLSKVTSPTKGNIKVKGRIASLLEVGTGFHPELSGRENIFLNGAILGMTKTEIRSKFDEIVAFSGVEKYIDTPVKRYSSGMYVRLAFAVAAHLEPEILIVDEVLAVGDAEFQKKCLGKMKDVSGEGRTVLFVSHNMLAVKSLCNQGVLLMNGSINSIGNIDNVVQQYEKQNPLSSNNTIYHKTEKYTIEQISISDNGVTGYFNIEEELIFEIKIEFHSKLELVNLNLFFNSTDGSTIFVSNSEAISVSQTSYIYQCKIPACTLNDNLYLIDLMVVENRTIPTTMLREVLTIEGIEAKREGSWLGKYPGLIRPTTYPWNILKN